MEKHKCKLCSRSFKCGRALGGHMRSHLMSLPVPLPPKASTSSHFQVRHGFESLSSSSEEDVEEKKDSLLVYGLRENPKKSVRIADHNPEVSSIAAAGSVVLQDRESETDNTKKNYKNPSRKRSRRVKQWKEIEQQQQKLRKFSAWEISFFTEPEPLSSVSDTSPEEDVAMCLVMLSRDKWMKNQEEEELENSSAAVAVADDEDEENLDSKFKCETCNKVFQSYQALGGHRASHKKSKMANFEDDVVVVMKQGTKSSGLDMKIHECSLCYKVFGSGQALGGHKRAHLLSAASASSSVIAASGSASADGEDDKCTVQLGGGASDGRNGCLIDLNLPPPMEDEEDNINYKQLVRLSLLSQF